MSSWMLAIETRRRLGLSHAVLGGVSSNSGINGRRGIRCRADTCVWHLCVVDDRIGTLCSSACSARQQRRQ